MARVSILILALAVNCSATAQTFPKTAEEAIGLIDAIPACGKRLTLPGARPPLFLSVCEVSRVPSFLNDIEAACSSQFDLDDSGKPINIRSECVLNPQHQLSEDVLSVARAAIDHLYLRDQADEQYAAIDSRFSNEIRTGLTDRTWYNKRDAVTPSMIIRSPDNKASER